MNYKEITGISIPDAFEDYNCDHPEIYQYFKKYVFELIHAGKKRIGAKMIMERIRWEVYLNIQTDRTFKINNVFTSYYARLFVRQHQEYKSYFEFRKLKNQSATQRKIHMK